MTEVRKKLTVPGLAQRKREGLRTLMVDATDCLMAEWAERAGIAVIGIGDSLAMTVYGHDTTLPLTVDQMIEHIRAVRLGAPNTLTLAAMPLGSHATADVAVHNALWLMKEGAVEIVKVHGRRGKFKMIKAMADAGVPVMSHVGMCPHFV